MKRLTLGVALMVLSMLGCRRDVVCCPTPTYSAAPAYSQCPPGCVPAATNCVPSSTCVPSSSYAPSSGTTYAPK